jgi:hypothetical protein
MFLPLRFNYSAHYLFTFEMQAVVRSFAAIAPILDLKPKEPSLRPRPLKDTFTCQSHVGKDQWCWVDPHVPDAGHIPLSLHDMHLWARHLVRRPSSTNICFSEI